MRSTQPFNPYIIQSQNYVLSRHLTGILITPEQPNVDELGDLKYLNVKGTSRLNGIINEGEIIQEGPVELYGDLHVTGVSTFDDTIIANGGIECNGDLTVSGTLIVNKIKENTIYEGNLLVKGDLDVTGESRFNDTIYAMNGIHDIGDVYIKGDIGITGNTIQYGNIYQTGDLGITGNIYQTGDLGITGNIYQNGNFGITGISRFDGRVDIRGDVNLGANLYQNGNIGLTGNIYQRGNIGITGNEQINGTLSVRGTTNLNGNTQMNGNVGISGNIGITGSIYFDGDINLIGDIGITGDIYQDGNYGITGDIYEYGNLGITGNASVSGNLNVLGDVGITGNMYQSGNYGITGNIYQHGNLNVTGTTNLTGNLGVVGNLGVTGNVGIAGNVGVTGTTVFNGNVYMRGFVGITGDLGIYGDIYEYGDIGVTGDINVNGDVNIIGDFGITGNSYQYGNVGITGTTQLDGDLNITGDMGLTGTATFYEDVHINGILYASKSIFGNTGATGSSYVVNVLDDMHIDENLALEKSINYITFPNNEIQTLCYNPTIFIYGQDWNLTNPSIINSNYAGITDTPFQVAVINGGDIYVSSNYGSTWIAKSIIGNWSSVGISSSGQYQLGSINGGNLYLSTNYGNTFQSILTVQSWTDVAVSSFGKYQAAVGSGTNIYISNDYGTTWTATCISTNWYSVAISSSGKYISASKDNAIYYSQDYGNTWTLVTLSTVCPYYSISMSAYGQYQIVAGQNAYLSTNYGVTWSVLNIGSPTIYNYISVAMSASGQYITILSNTVGKNYVSIDYGQTFVLIQALLIETCLNVSMSPSARIQCITTGSGIYTSIGLLENTVPYYATEPANGTTGDMFFNTISEYLEVYNGTNWVIQKGQTGETGPTGQQGPSGVSGGLIGYLNYNVSGSTVGYKQLSGIPELGTTTYTSTVSVPGADVLVNQFVTDNGYPNTNLLPAGIISVLMFAKIDHNSNLVLYGKLLIVHLDNSTTEITTTANSGYVLNSSNFGEVNCSGVITSNVTLLYTDRIAIQIYATLESGTTPNLTTSYQGTTYSRIQTSLYAPIGPTGPTGPIGPTGATGETGAPGSYTDANFNVYGGTGSLQNKVLGVGGAFYNTANGYNTLYDLTVQDYNTAIGYNSGMGVSGNNTNASYNTFVGSQTGLISNSDYRNSTAIGYNSKITDSYQIVLGTPTEYVYIPSTTSSTQVNNGAFVVAGGAGIGGSVYVGGNEGISGTITVGGTGTFQNAVAINGTLNVGSTGTFQGNVGVSGNLSVGGTSLFINDVTVQKSLTVGTTGYFNSGMGVTGTMYVNGGIITTGYQYITGSLELNGNETVNGDLRVTNKFYLGANSYQESSLSTQIINNGVQAYTSTVPNGDWRSIATSYTAQYQVAFLNLSTTSSSIYTSYNFGSTWTNSLNISCTSGYNQTPTTYISNTGQYQICGIQRQIFYSTNYGYTWTTVSGTNGAGLCSPSSIYTSGNITYFTNGSGNGTILSSSNYGATSTNLNSNVGQSLGASTNAQYILAGSFSIGQGNMYVSSNNGSSWSNTGVYGLNVAVSGNGQYMAGINGATLYISNNYGIAGSWASYAQTFDNISLSETGQYMVACVLNGLLYYSSNFGVSWTAITTVNQAWTSIRISGNGSIITGVNGISSDKIYIYTTQISGLNIQSKDLIYFTINNLNRFSMGAGFVGVSDVPFVCSDPTNGGQTNIRNVGATFVIQPLYGMGSPGGGSNITFRTIDNNGNLGDRMYLNYAAMNLYQGLNVTGNIVLNGGSNYVQYANGKRQITSYTGFTGAAATYTNASITVDADGRITNLTNGDDTDLTNVTSQLLATLSLNGGGNVTWYNNYLKWQGSILAAPVPRSYGSSGYFTIPFPPIGTAITRYDGSGVTLISVTSDGIPLESADALYYVITVGQSEDYNYSNFIVINLNANWNPTQGYLMIALVSSFQNLSYLKYIPAMVTMPNNSSYDISSSWMQTYAQLKWNGFTGFSGNDRYAVTITEKTLSLAFVVNTSNVVVDTTNNKFTFKLNGFYTFHYIINIDDGGTTAMITRVYNSWGSAILNFEYRYVDYSGNSSILGNIPINTAIWGLGPYYVTMQTKADDDILLDTYGIDSIWSTIWID